MCLNAILIIIFRVQVIIISVKLPETNEIFNLCDIRVAEFL